MIDLEQARSLSSARWATLAKATAGLCLVAALVAWCALLGADGNGAFLQQNTLLRAKRDIIVIGMLASAATVLVFVLIMLAARRWDAVPFLERCRIATAPLGVVAFLPVLLQPSVWFRNPLPFLAMLAVLVLILERTLRSWLAEFTPALAPLTRIPVSKWGLRFRRAVPLAIVLIASTAFAAFVYHFSVQQHQRLNTAAYDLGIYDNLMFAAIKGHPFRSTVLLGPDGPSYLVGHAEFAMLFFTPIYWLWPKAETLLVLQALALGFAAVPLYLFARIQVTRGAGVVLALAYLLYAPLHGSCFYDFHWLPITIIFQFTLYLAIATRRWWLFGCCYVILTLIREDVSVGLTVLGIFLLLSGIRPRLGLLMMVLSAISFVGIKFGIMLYAGPFVFPSLIYSQLVASGENDFGSVVRTLLTNPLYVVGTLLDPKKGNYFLHLFAPLVFLPLRKPLLVLLISGAVIFTFLTTAYEPTVSINFQYPAHWIPYCFAAVVLMLGQLSKAIDGTVRRRAALGALAFGVSTHSFVFGAVLQHDTYVGGFLPLSYKISEAEQETYAALRKVVAKIPPQASVAATDMEVPHVSNRLTVFTLRSHHGDADYLLVNRNAVASDTRNILRDAVNRNDYGLVGTEGPFYLFKKDAVGQDTEKAFSALNLKGRERKRHKKGSDK